MNNLEKAKKLNLEINYCCQNESYGSHYQDFLKQVKDLKVEIEKGCGVDVNPAGSIEYPCGNASLTLPKQYCYDCQEALDICTLVICEDVNQGRSEVKNG